MLSKIGPGQFRLILAVLVVVEHLSRMEVGKVAVMVFFVLSGYWVSKIYTERFLTKSSDVIAFYISRFLRVWPMYMIAISIAYFIATFSGTGVSSNSYWVIPIFGIATHGVDLINVSWSLDIELQFYAILPFFLFLMGFAKTKVQRICGLILMLLLSVIGWHVGLVYGFQTALMYLPLFAAGVAIHLLDIHVGQKTAFWSSFLFCAFAVGIYSVPETRQFVFGGSGDTNYDRLFALFWGLLLFGFVAFNVRQESSWLDRHMGNLSYTLYLLHIPFIHLTRNVINRDLEIAEKIVFLPILLFICIIAYILFEVKLDVMRRYINRRVRVFLE